MIPQISDSPPHGGRVNLLLVDDEPRNLLTLREVLSDLDVNLVFAHSGKEALKLILRHKFAVVLLDVKMPGISGLEVARLMRQRAETRETPIIFVTGYHDSELYVSKGYELGAVDYLIKPLNPQILLAKVRVFVELHRKTVALERQREIAVEELRRNQELNRKNLDLARLKKEAEQFAYIASHDLQTPLRHIGTFIEVLRDPATGPLNESQAEAVSIIAGGAKRMKSLISDLLELSRIGRQSLSLQPSSLAELIDDVLQSLSAEISTTGAEVIVSELPSAVFDWSKMRQVFLNLLSNALKYRVSDTCPVIEIGAETSPDGCVVFVRDNGIGIEHEHFSRIFEIFQRLHSEKSYSGTGIGLAICKKIVELHGGEIWVDSEAGRGSCFSVLIPGSPDKDKRTYEYSKNPDGRRPGGRSQASQLGVSEVSPVN